MKEQWTEKASFLDKFSTKKRDYEAPKVTPLLDESPGAAPGSGADGGATGSNFGS